MQRALLPNVDVQFLMPAWGKTVSASLARELTRAHESGHAVLGTVLLLADPLIREAGGVRGGYGVWGKRPFDPEAAGGPIRSLSTDGVRITDRGIGVVERHLARFGPDAPNEGMMARLREVSAGRLQPEPVDLNGQVPISV